MKNKNLRIVLAGLLLGGVYQASCAITVDEGIALIKAENATEFEAQLKEATPLQLYALSGYVDGKIADEWQKVIKKHKVLGFMADLPFDPVFLLTHPAYLLEAAIFIGTTASLFWKLDSIQKSPEYQSAQVGVYMSLPAIHYGAQSLAKKALQRFLASNSMKSFARSKQLIEDAVKQLQNREAYENADFKETIDSLPANAGERIALLLTRGNLDEARAILMLTGEDQLILAQGIIDAMVHREIGKVKKDKKVAALIADKSAIPATLSLPFPLMAASILKPKQGNNTLIVGYLSSLFVVPGVVAYLIYKLPKMIAERQLTNDTIKQLQALKKEITEHRCKFFAD